MVYNPNTLVFFIVSPDAQHVDACDAYYDPGANRWWADKTNNSAGTGRPFKLKNLTHLAEVFISSDFQHLIISGRYSQVQLRNATEGTYDMTVTGSNSTSTYLLDDGNVSISSLMFLVTDFNQNRMVVQLYYHDVLLSEMPILDNNFEPFATITPKLSKSRDKMLVGHRTFGGTSVIKVFAFCNSTTDATHPTMETPASSFNSSISIDRESIDQEDYALLIVPITIGALFCLVAVSLIIYLQRRPFNLKRKEVAEQDIVLEQNHSSLKIDVLAEWTVASADIVLEDLLGEGKSLRDFKL